MITLFYLFLFVLLGLCLMLASVILVQESKSMGLGASFGGDARDSLFGTSTAAVLKKFTAYLAGIFVIICLLLSFWSSSLARSRPAEVLPEVEIEAADS